MNNKKRTRIKKAATERKKRLLFRKYFYLVIFIVVASTSAFFWVMWKNGVVEKITSEIASKAEKINYQASSSLGLILKDIYVEGEKHVSEKLVMQKLNIKLGMPILSLSLSDMKEQLEEIEWVEEASIERHIPSAIHVRIKEKEPVAIWKEKDEKALIDRNGSIISKRYTDDFPNLPVVIGKEANIYFEPVFKMIKTEPELQKKVQSIIRIGERRWNIVLNNKTEIRLPEDRPEEAWSLLASLNKKKNILKKDIEYIDMRVEDRIFIKPSSGSGFSAENIAGKEIDAIKQEKKGEFSFDKVINAVKNLGKKKE